MRSKWLYAAPVALAALLAGAWLAQTRYAPRAPSVPVAQLWRLSFPDTERRPQSLAQWRGKVLVLNFWASWCAPCREEMPEFVAVRSQYARDGVEFVGIAIDSPANVARFLASQPVPYPILVGEGAAHSLARELGNPSGALPYTIVLDRDGEVVLRHLGRLPRATLEAALLKTRS
jgi:thiol-disulfide isomerase/thioredoxin